MSKIRSAEQLLSWLQDGELSAEFSTAFRDVVAACKQIAGDRPKGKAKGEVSMAIRFEMEDGIMRMTGEVKRKTPKAARASSMAWPLDDGSLSTEHPRQMQMFPRDIAARPRNDDVIDVAAN